MSSLPPNNNCLGSQEKNPPKETKTFNILLPLPQFLLPSTTLHVSEYLFGESGSAVPAMFPPSFSPTLTESEHTHWRNIVGKIDKALICASAVQPQPKHRCVVNIFLATNPNWTLWAAVKNINSIPDRPRTLYNLSSQQMQWQCQKAWRIQGQNFHTAPSCLEKANPLPCYFMLYLICSTSGFTTPLSYPNF